MVRILVVDDERNYGSVLSRLLETEGHTVFTALNPFAALDLLSREHIELILSDMKMPGMNGMEFFRKVREDIGDIPFIILTAFATVETAVQALKDGVFDYLMKPFNNEEILATVRRALDYSRLQIENAALRRQVERDGRREIIGRSPAIHRLIQDIARVAPAPTSVLITGETGTGKELVARAVHRASPRSEGPLVSLNCAAFAANLLESELFGHERGAFTGAGERKRGLLEVASGGTLFLDEIGELPLALQPKLLRVLEEKRFRRVGGVTELTVDVRLVAATHRDLQERIAAGDFREDLFYRLNVVTLKVPALRDRPEDIPLLALHFLRRFAVDLGRPVDRIEPTVLELLQGHAWPGNVRELQNVMERGVLFCAGRALRPEDLPAPLVRESASPGLNLPEFGDSLPQLLDGMERELIRRALARSAGIQAQAADLLGISRSNLQYKLKKHNLL